MKTKKVVTYARIGSVEHGLTNPCQPQQDAMKIYCKKHKLKIIGHYEDIGYSGTDNNRPQLNAFLQNLKSGSIKPDILLSEQPYRFTRNLISVIKILEILEKHGVEIRYTTESVPMDNSGVFSKNIELLFSKYNSEQRKHRIIAGMTARLEEGRWCFRAPEGYENITRNKVKQIIPNKNSKFILKAFKLRASERKSNTEIANYLMNKGYKISSKKLSRIFSNAFYCGLITHWTLGDAIIQGKHPAIISESLFFKINPKKRHLKILSK